MSFFDPPLWLQGFLSNMWQAETLLCGMNSVSFSQKHYISTPTSCASTLRLFSLEMLCKVIQMNQLDATMIYWSIRSAQHVSGNILPIIRSVGLSYLQHMVSCIQKKQLDATMIYWSIRSAQHVSGNILPIIRSVGLSYLQHMVSCCCGG